MTGDGRLTFLWEGGGGGGGTSNTDREIDTSARGSGESAAQTGTGKLGGGNCFYSSINLKDNLLCCYL